MAHDTRMERNDGIRCEVHEAEPRYLDIPGGVGTRVYFLIRRFSLTGFAYTPYTLYTNDLEEAPPILSRKHEDDPVRVSTES